MSVWLTSVGSSPSNIRVSGTTRLTHELAFPIPSDPFGWLPAALLKFQCERYKRMEEGGWYTGCTYYKLCAWRGETGDENGARLAARGLARGRNT